MPSWCKSGAVTDLPHLRVYLDANVLFSASLHPDSRFLGFWRLRGISPVTSQYAIAEVTRHLEARGHAQRLADLLARTQIVSDADERLIPARIALVAKDAPILAAAIAASVDYLATGDRKHFAHLYKGRISGVTVLSPTDFLALFDDRLIR